MQHETTLNALEHRPSRLAAAARMAWRVVTWPARELWTWFCIFRDLLSGEPL